MNIVFSTSAGSFTATSNHRHRQPGGGQPVGHHAAAVGHGDRRAWRFATQPVVKEEDAFGNVITSDSTHTVTAARHRHVQPAGQCADGHAVSGVATFSGLFVQHGRDDQPSFQHQRQRRHGHLQQRRRQPGGGQPVGRHHRSRRPRPRRAWPSATQPVVKEEDAFGNVVTSDSTHTVTAARGTLGYVQPAGHH